jgi:hypothetical protein
MRHRDLRMTIGTYGHLSPGYMRCEVDCLRFLRDAAIPAEALEELPALASGEKPASLGQPWSKRVAERTKRPGQGRRIPWKPGRLCKRGVRDLNP